MLLLLVIQPIQSLRAADILIKVCLQVRDTLTKVYRLNPVILIKVCRLVQDGPIKAYRLPLVTQLTLCPQVAV